LAKFQSLCSITDLGTKNIETIRFLINLEDLELGECTGFNEFGSKVLTQLHNLERLRLEKVQDSLCSRDILISVSQMQKLTNLELVDIKVTPGFEDNLQKCKNITKLLLIPNYEYQIALSNNTILKATAELTSTLKHFIWCFNDKSFQFSQTVFKQSVDKWLPFLKPIPHFELLERNNHMDKSLCRNQLSMFMKALAVALEDKETSVLKTSKLDMLSLSNLQELYAIILPHTKVDLMKIAARDQ
jgi:hypothetical protein